MGSKQFGLGLVRSLSMLIHSLWEKFANHPLLIDLPGNSGLDYTFLVLYKGKTWLYTSLDKISRRIF